MTELKKRSGYLFRSLAAGQSEDSIGLLPRGIITRSFRKLPRTVLAFGILLWIPLSSLASDADPARDRAARLRNWHFSRFRILWNGISALKKSAGSPGNGGFTPRLRKFRVLMLPGHPRKTLHPVFPGIGCHSGKFTVPCPDRIPVPVMWYMPSGLKCRNRIPVP